MKQPITDPTALGVIRSSIGVCGTRIYCEATPTGYDVYIRWAKIHRTDDIDEALAVFEGLCLHDVPSRKSKKNLVLEARRHRRSAFANMAAWEAYVIENARRRDEGLRPVYRGKNVIEWVTK